MVASAQHWTLISTSLRHTVDESACTIVDETTAVSSGTATSDGFKYSTSVPAQRKERRKPTATMLSLC